MPRKKERDVGSESAPIAEKRVDSAVSSRTGVEMERKDHCQATSDGFEQLDDLTEEERKKTFRRALKETIEKDKTILEALAKL